MFLDLWPLTSVIELVRDIVQMDGRTDGTENITSTTDTGGKNIKKPSLLTPDSDFLTSPKLNLVAKKDKSLDVAIPDEVTSKICHIQ